jgi:MgsA AAA+ ATPase C terminal
MFIQRTPSGHPFDEATSAFQKAIRRGHTNAALYWGHELWTKFPAYFWRRFMIIVSEDLAADPMTAVIIGQLAQNAVLATKNFSRPATELIEAQAVLVAARAPKSREPADAQNLVVRAKAKGWRVEPPAYAVDKHTARGKQLRRTLRDFALEGRRIAGPPGRNDFEIPRWGFVSELPDDADVEMPPVEHPLDETHEPTLPKGKWTPPEPD